MLNVPCGISGRARVVLTDSVSGNVTHDTGEFENVWTDVGLASISVYSSQHALWPNRLLYGSGVRAQPHTGVTTLQNYIGHLSVSYDGKTDGVVYDETTCTVTRTVNASVPARGVPWTLSELGLGNSSQNTTAFTYTPTKDMAGSVKPVQVSAIEIVTIYYTVQVQYPMTLPPMGVNVVGLPPTTATFTLRPDLSGFVSYGMGASSPLTDSDTIKGFTSAAFAGAVKGVKTGTRNVWGINDLNRQTEYFGSNIRGAHHTWKLDPPITKSNTQVLELEIFWQFSNATPIEIP